MDSTVALDADLALYRLELRRQPELWSDSGRPQLRASEVQVVPTLEDMIREFVPRREAHAARRPLSIDDIAAGDFRLFAAVLREAGNHERVAVRAEHRTAAFVKPLRRNAHDAGRRFSASQPVSKHADAVGRRVLGLLRVVHRVAVFRASQVRQAGARHQAACRLDGVIDWWQQLPGRAAPHTPRRSRRPGPLRDVRRARRVLVPCPGPSMPGHASTPCPRAVEGAVRRRARRAAESRQ